MQARLVGWTAQVNILNGNEVSVRFCVILESKLGSNKFHTGRALSGRNQSDEPRTSLQNVVDFETNRLASVMLKVLREKHVVLGRIHDEVKVRLQWRAAFFLTGFGHADHSVGEVFTREVLFSLIISH